MSTLRNRSTRRPERFFAAGALAAVMSLGAVSCTGPDDPATGPIAPDFGLSDVNRASPTFQNRVSPRMYAGQVSAWYFGHAT